MKFKRIAIDTSKHVFTLHGVDEQERLVLRRELKRGQVEAFFAKQDATEVVLEACGGSHHWGRLLNKLGHRVRLIPPQYVKPFVKRAKNDRNDAEAISEAASRPSMRSVVVKTLEQQADGIILKHREMLVGQRTQAINALRGHAAEFGVVAAKGIVKVAALLAVLAADSAIPATARAMFARMGVHIEALDHQVTAVDDELAALHKANSVSQLLAAIPGVGPLGAITLALTVEPGNFASGRHFAAWLGLTPKEHSTGGKQRLGKISKAAMKGCGNCCSSAPCPSSASPNRTANPPRGGCCNCWSASHASSPRSLWPTRWPGLSGP
jgi:transposase